MLREEEFPFPLAQPHTELAPALGETEENAEAPDPNEDDRVQEEVADEIAAVVTMTEATGELQLTDATSDLPEREEDGATAVTG